MITLVMFSVKGSPVPPETKAFHQSISPAGHRFMRVDAKE